MHGMPECYPPSDVPHTLDAGVCTECGVTVESDRDFRTRIINAYGMWGAFCSVVLESSGKALDDCAKHVGLTRLATHDAAREGVSDE